MLQLPPLCLSYEVELGRVAEQEGVDQQLGIRKWEVCEEEMNHNGRREGVLWYHADGRFLACGPVVKHMPRRDSWGVTTGQRTKNAQRQIHNRSTGAHAANMLLALSRT